jgi:hypothetical protein
LNVTMVDYDGDVFNWTIQTSPNIGSNFGNNANNGSKSCSVSGLSYSTTYSWFVNVSDGYVWTNETYSFATVAAPINNPPSISNPSITNGTVNISLSTSSLSVSINEPEGNSFNWTIQTSPNIGSNSGNGASNGTKSCSISGLSYATTYYWYVNATDGNSWKREYYTFTTRPQYTPNAPSSFIATANGRFQIDLSWIKGSMADYTRVEWYTSSDGSWDVGDHNLLYNGSGTSTSQSGLSPGTKRYYKAWSWNSTDSVWGSGVTSNATTNNNNALNLGSPNPSNNSVNQSLSLTWSISITDSDGDTFNWTIACSNGQSSSANGASNGTKQLSVSCLG